MGAEEKKLSWRLEILGVEHAAQTLKNLQSAKEALMGVGRPTGASVLDKMSDTLRRLNPQLVQMLRTSKDLGKPATALGAFLNQSLGIGAGQNVFRGHARTAYEQFWKNAVPPVLGAGGATEGGGGIRGLARSFNFLRIPTFLPLVGSLTAINFAFKTLTTTVNEAKRAIQTAFGIYTGAAQQGLSSRFFAQRQFAASVLGVQGNPNNVFYFGKAFQEVSARINESTQIIAGNAPRLAQVEMNWRILKIDFDALASSLVTRLIPAFDLMMAATDQFVKYLTRHAMLLLAPLLASPAGIMMLDAISKKLRTDPAFAAFFKGTTPLGIMAKQLPASQMEHMGLVIGGGFQQQALEYQKRAAITLEKIYQRMESQRRDSSGSYYMGRNPFITQP